MLYVDIEDACKAFRNYIAKILSANLGKEKNELSQIVNVFYPEPITILELAEMVGDAIVKHSNGKIQPPIEIIDTGKEPIFTEEDKKKFIVNLGKARKFLGLTEPISPRESIDRIVRSRIVKGINSVYQNEKNFSWRVFTPPSAECKNFYFTTTS